MKNNIIYPDWCSIKVSDRAPEDAIQGDVLLRAKSDDLDENTTYTMFPYDPITMGIMREDEKDISVKWYIIVLLTASASR